MKNRLEVNLGAKDVNSELEQSPRRQQWSGLR